MFIIYFKQILKDYKKITATFFGQVGVLTLIYELFAIFFPKQIDKLNLNYNWFISIIIFFLITSIIKNWPKLKRRFTIKNKDINVTIVVGDIFKQKGAKVIPTNTTFDTYMEGEFISKNSVQGQFQEKYFMNNLTILDDMIRTSLKETKIISKLTDNRKTKKERYDCGTVSKINYLGDKYYLLALADVNKYGTPSATYQNILTALQGLWNFLSQNKHIENLVLPIIGTGRAGIVEATRMQVIKDTILSFIALSNEIKITNNLVLCIHPNDLKNNKLDINEIFQYVEYTSKYKYDEFQLEKHNNGIPLK